MIPLELQDGLKDELIILFENKKYKNAKGELVSLNIYTQDLPAKQGQKDKDHFPYVLIGIEDGDSNEIMDDDIANISILIAMYDENADYQGYRDTVNVANKIMNYLNTHRIINQKYSLEYPIKYFFSTDNTYPYHFLAINTAWIVPKLTMNDDLL